MALSQIQCLDDNHVNLRTNESKPEFLYCEDQRLAVETFLQDGREAFAKYLGARGLRGFLSDRELEALAETVEPYDPGSEVFPETAEDGEPPTALSMHYWPELSDTSVPQMDLGWPENVTYRGVTRTTVYTQPPLEGQAHIKEVVRKMIAQAQKVIAVVMDVFTDVDIFRDLLDAGFKRKVSVYILLERKTLPHFRSMCQRADMHAGHLKNLRVRCADGAEFHTRSCTKVRGRMGHRFMFIDGDKAVSGSYSFTWTSSRLDKNLITVVTGQAVEAFDRLFRVLYATSGSVDLRKVVTEPEPELEPLPLPAAVAAPSAEIARKLYSPKYALVALGNPSPTSSAGAKETPEKDPETKNQRGKGESKESTQEAPPLHPGLINLEKACMIAYLPTWPEPDPPSDVIGFINIRDAKKSNQVHLQRSELFETSQAIRFSSPFSMPKENLPEVAKPRQFTAKHEDVKKLQTAEKETKAEEVVAGRAKKTQLNAGPGDIKTKAEALTQKPPASGPKCEPDTVKTLNSENKRHSNTPTNQDASHNATPQLNAHTPDQSSSKASTPNTGKPTHAAQSALPGSNTKKEAGTHLNTRHAGVFKTNTPEPSTTRASRLCNTEPHTQTTTAPPHTDSHTQAVHMQPQNSPMSSSSTSAPCSQPVSSTALSENNHVSTTASVSTSSSSSIPPPPSSSTTPNPPLPSPSASPSLTSTPPIPKLRTVKLVIKGGAGASDSQKLPEFSVVKRPETSAVVHNEPDVATAAQTSPKKLPETVPEPQRNSGTKTEAQKNANDKLNIGAAPQQKQSRTSQEAKNEEADGRREREGMQLVTGNKAQSDVLITDAPKTESVNIQEKIPKDVRPKTLISMDCRLTPQIDCVATVQTETKAPEKSENVMEHKTYLARAGVPQRISYSELTPQDIDVLETVDSLKAPTHTSVSATHTSKDSAGDNAHTRAADTRGQRGNASLEPAQRADSTPNTAKHNTQSTFQEQITKARGSTHTPERPLRLHLSDVHMPDLRSPTPERESRLLAALSRTTTPDGFLPGTPTPDSQMHTSDPRSYTPDFRTPTPDGYVTPRADSALSTTSDEYYECSDSSFHDSVFERAASRSDGTTEDHISFTLTNAPNAATIIPSPAYVNSNACANTLGAKMGEEKATANEENGRAMDEKGRKLNVAERRGSEEAKRTADHFKQGKNTTETEEKNKEIQAPKRKRVLNQSAERVADGGVTPGEFTNERTEPKLLSAGEIQPKKAPPEAKRPDKDKAALGPNGVGRMPPSSRDTDGQKLLHTSPKTSQRQQQDSGSSSPSRPSRPPRPLSGSQAFGPHAWGGQQQNQAESRMFHSSYPQLDNTSSPRRPPSRPPPPMTAGAVGSAAGRRQTEVSLARQPLAAQGRTRAGQSQNQHPYPKPQPSFLHTHLNRELYPHSQNQTVAPRDAHWQDEGKAPFSFTFSRLYNLKGLKDKMSKLPAQSKRGSASSPGQGQGRKSTS